MNLWFGLVIGLKEIWAHKFRSFLTMLGVILGVASLQSMFALTAGIASGMRETLLAVGGLEQVRVTQSEPSPDKQDLAEISQGRTFNDAIALRAGAPLISHISPEIHQGMRIERDQHRVNTSVHGAVPDYAVVNAHEIKDGRFLVDLDIEQSNRVVVIGEEIVHELWPDDPNANPLGETIFLNQRPFIVVGVFPLYEREADRKRREEAAARPGARQGRIRGGWGGAFRWKNRSVVIPITTMQYEFRSANVVDGRDEGPDPRLSELRLRIADVEQFDLAIQQVTQILNNTHRGIDDFEYDTREDWFDQISASVRSTRLSGGIIAGISLLVGGIGITNIMLASITERIREIGVRRAIGARSRDIFVQILVESVVTAILGGIIGLLLSFGMIHLLTVIAPSQNDPIIEPASIVISFGFAFLIGLIAGIYPAWKASRLDPIQALRYE